MSDAPTEVRNDTATNRFVVAEDGAEAELRYRKRAGRLILIHTDVPDALGGRGIGGRLVRAAIADAQAEHLTIVPWCPFARQWLTDHPTEAQAVPIDWDTLPPPGNNPMPDGPTPE
jgi:predicted GNAT family acetyltransferase